MYCISFGCQCISLAEKPFSVSAARSLAAHCGHFRCGCASSAHRLVQMKCVSVSTVYTLLFRFQLQILSEFFLENESSLKLQNSIYVLSCFSVGPEIIVLVCWTLSNQLINQNPPPHSGVPRTQKSRWSAGGIKGSLLLSLEWVRIWLCMLLLILGPLLTTCLMSAFPIHSRVVFLPRKMK